MTATINTTAVQRLQRDRQRDDDDEDVDNVDNGLVEEWIV